jgi:hypothetical protein
LEVELLFLARSYPNILLERRSHRMNKEGGQEKASESEGVPEPPGEGREERSRAVAVAAEGATFMEPQGVPEQSLVGQKRNRAADEDNEGEDEEEEEAASELGGGM